MRRLALLFYFLLVPFVVRASNSVVRSVADGIDFRNDFVSIILSNDAELISLVDLRTNIDIAPHERSKIAYAKTNKGTVIEANKLELTGNKLTISFGAKSVGLRIDAFDSFFVVEVQNTSLSDVDVLTFIDIKVSKDAVSGLGLAFCGIPLSLQTYPVLYPSVGGAEVIGRCFDYTGFNGSKLAVLACPKERIWDQISFIYKTLPSGTIPVAYASGGPFAHESSANREDCVIIDRASISPKYVPQWIDFFTKIGVRQVNFFMGHLPILQGQTSYPGRRSIDDFKEQITDPLYVAGINSTLHCYSFYIDDGTDEILSNPKWQQQLEFRGDFKLTKDISSDDIDIPVKGDLSGVKDLDSYTCVYSPYFLIDNEIVRYTIGKNGFINCKRGQCGTFSTLHKRGAIVRIIGGYYGHIAPIIGSELYFEVARRIADAYNKGGFRGLYFDAIDGLRVHLDKVGLFDYQWYYGGLFVNEVLKHCTIAPSVIEYSQMTPALWASRGRGECWDTPNRGYKNFIDDHTSRNQTLMKRNYIATLGWYNLYPTRVKQPGNYSTKYMFSDDVDYLGVKCIAYDQTMVYNGLKDSDIENIPALKRNLDSFIRYSKLRRENYFEDNVKKLLQDGKYEYKLSFKNGRWGFYEVRYIKNKIRDIAKDALIGNNSFKRQRPFIRLENLYTSEGSSAINLMQFDEKKDFVGQKTSKVLPSPVDLRNHLAIRISVKGNGKNSSDALCVRLTSTDMSGYADYVVRLNFDGWREIVLSNLDNGEYGDLTFKGMDDDYYQVHRNNVNFAKINHIRVYRSGDCKDVRVRSIDAVPIEENPLVQPVIHIGKASVTFLDTIQSGEYIEYNVGDKTALVYDRDGNSRSIKINRTGRFIVPKGSFEAFVTGSPELKNAPSEVTLTFGLYGKYIHN